mgnify:CR=1 FL=1
MTIDGKLYHVSKNGYAIDRYAKGLHEIDGGMYYVKEDGSFLTNSAVEYLTFDANGRYTSGNATLDSYVDQALAACTNSGMTKAQKLRAAYLYVRDHGAYLARPHQARGTTAWAEESALFMFEHKKGNCYCFAGQFLYMARRLGYNAYVVSGGVGRKDSDHAWVMICENGVPYIYDVELEWGYRAGRYGHAEYNMYLAQAFTTGGRSQVNSTAYKGGWEFLSMNRHPQWRRHYYDIGVNFNEMIASAEEAGYTNFPLIGRTIRLMSTQLTTDAFGDMPLTEAYQATASKYDTQEFIYQWMLTEVDDLLAQYNNAAVTGNPANIAITRQMDRIYSGDLKKWRQFTYALKARILLRKLPNWDNNQAACEKIIAAVDAALTEDWEEPIYKFDVGVGEANSPWGPAKPKIGGWESRSNDLDKTIPSKYLMDDMFGIFASVNPRTGYAKDPRMEALMKPRKGADGRTAFRYLECNIGMDASAKESHYPDLYCASPLNTTDETVNPYTKNDGYIPLFLTEELMLIKAEALYWKGDKTGSREWTVKAVEKSFERFNCNPKYTGNLDGYASPQL